MTDQTEAVLLANAQFYRALAVADINVMRRIWIDSPHATCQHPGWNPVAGTEAILQSWTAIFVNQGPVHIWPTQASVEQVEGLLWVTCVENIDATASDPRRIVQTSARNAYCYTAQGWKMLHHLAEPLPVLEHFPVNFRLALN